MFNLCATLGFYCDTACQDSKDPQAFKTTILTLTTDGLPDLNLFVTRSDRTSYHAQHHPFRLAWVF